MLPAFTHRSKQTPADAGQVNRCLATYFRTLTGKPAPAGCARSLCDVPGERVFTRVNRDANVRSAG